MFYHIDMITHSTVFVEPVSSVNGISQYMLVEFHLSETNGLCRARTWTAHMADRDANNYDISPSLHMVDVH